MIGLSNSASEVTKADFIRWYILAQEGGLFIDTDILFFKPVDILKQIMEFDISLQFERWFTVGFLASNKHDFFKQMYQDAILKKDMTDYQALGTKLIAETYNFKQLCEKYKIFNIPTEYVYPIPYRKPNSFFNKDMPRIPQGCIGIHWFGGTPSSGRYQNTLTKENFKGNILAEKYEGIGQ